MIINIFKFLLNQKLKSDVDCLNLTFGELCHIRNVLTKAELDYLLFDDQLFQDVSKGKICFSCRKTKFNLFNWGCKCRICQQKICKKCLRNVRILFYEKKINSILHQKDDAFYGIVIIKVPLKIKKYPLKSNQKIHGKFNFYPD